MEKHALPLGFGMALAQNEQAMNQFGRLTEPQKQAVIQRTKKVKSKNEMSQFVSELARSDLSFE